MDIIATLKNCNIFKGLNEPSLQRIAEGSQIRNYVDGAQVFPEGATFDLGLFVVLEGEVVVTTELEDKGGTDSLHEDFFLTAIGAGDSFGEVSVLDGGPRTASIRSRGATVCLFIPSAYIHMLAQTDPRTGYVVMRNIGILIARRLREMDFAIKNQAFLG